jgi:hypothetical protein
MTDISAGSNLLAGTWRLLAAESRDSTGVPDLPFGGQPEGLLMYDPDGNMSVHVMRGNRPPFTSDDVRGGTTDELCAAFEGYAGYFGRYTVDTARGVVTHHLRGASFPNWTGSDQVREYRLEGRRLTLSTPPIASGGRSVRFALVWERLR